MCVYVCLYMPMLDEMNDSNDTRDGREELGLFLNFKVTALPVKWYSFV